MTRRKSTDGKSYAGLDVSLRETAVCVLNEQGSIIFEAMIATDPDLIADCLAKQAPGLARVGLEAGATSAWLWRGLQQRNVPAVCLDSRHAHRVLSMRTHKTDRNDARGLAELVRMGWFREARVRSRDAQFVRSMLIAREHLIRTRRQLENLIRGSLKALGVMTGPTGGKTFMARVAELRNDNDWLHPILAPLMAAHSAVRDQLKVLDRTVIDTARQDADVRRMMTVPGVGVISALAFKSAIDDPRRFRSSAQVGAYLSLTPRQYESGESAWVGGIGPANDPMLRSCLYEAAGSLMMRCKRWSPLKAWGVRLAKRIGWKRASIALARKLAVTMHAIWRDGTEFVWSQAEAARA